MDGGAGCSTSLLFTCNKVRFLIDGSGVARTSKILQHQREIYWIKQWFSKLERICTQRAVKSLSSYLVTSLYKCYNFYVASAYLRNGSYASGWSEAPLAIYTSKAIVVNMKHGRRTSRCTDGTGYNIYNLKKNKTFINTLWIKCLTLPDEHSEPPTGVHIILIKIIRKTMFICFNKRSRNESKALFVICAIDVRHETNKTHHGRMGFVQR